MYIYICLTPKKNSNAGLTPKNLPYLNMELKIKYQDDILVAHVSGEFLLEDACEGFKQLLDVIQQQSATKIIINGLDIQGKITSLESYEYGVYIAKALHQLIIDKKYNFQRFAYVLKPTFYDKNELIGEIVASNLGAQVKVFYNMKEALGWLEEIR